MCKRCPFTSSATDSFIIIIYASGLLNYGCCFGVLLGPGKLLVTPNKVYAGSNKVDLTSGPAYVHPAEKQCNYNYSHPLEKQCDYSVNVVNNLVSGSTTDALSAYQGNLLSQRIAALEDDIDPSRMQHLAELTLVFDSSLTSNFTGTKQAFYPQTSISTRNYNVLYIEVDYRINVRFRIGVNGGSGSYSFQLGRDSSSQLALFGGSVYSTNTQIVRYDDMKSFVVYPSSSNLAVYTNKEHTGSIIQNITSVYVNYTERTNYAEFNVQSGSVTLNVYAK